MRFVSKEKNGVNFMNKIINLRKAVLTDLPSIETVDNDAFGTHPYGLLVLRQYFDITGNLFFVAENEQIIGYGIGAISYGTSEGWIVSLGVSSTARQMGVGEKLAVKLIDELLRAGAEVILLTVEQQNTGARRLYEKLGFIEREFAANYYGTGEDRMVMTRRASY